MHRSNTWMDAKTGDLHFFQLKRDYGEVYTLFRTIVPYGTRYGDRFYGRVSREKRVRTRLIRGELDARMFWDLMSRQLNNHRRFIRMDR